jgi:hypothetical protein
MINNHPADADIQQFVLDEKSCEADTIAHIHSCESCISKAENYRLLFSEIEKQPKAVFDFNLAELVIPQLAVPEKINPKNYFSVYLIACCILAAISVTGYFFRASITIFYKKYFPNISSGLSKNILYLLLSAALLILIFQSIEMVKKYQRKIDDLNFY